MKPLSVVSKSQNASHHDKTIKGTHRTNRHKAEATMFPLSLMLYIQSRMTSESTVSQESRVSKFFEERLEMRQVVAVLLHRAFGVVPLAPQVVQKFNYFHNSVAITYNSATNLRK